ncbi:sensor histidine kinase [Streptomyces rubellomurinus]|uniref:histidine kinase n=1 Tax=Streptomyces rubellomurinus (strain ATCC 31215) TaxID=359131 RepID=A0A0F2TIU4_STRR3|nr:sensor histidine kinase [Streptomyces rubellomurinus]KJS61637.1 histidine kinase [Streptomyces rubellomurinus]
MKQLLGWPARAGTGFLRACAVAGVTMTVPALWAAAAALGVHGGAGNPWSWLLPVVLAVTGTLAASRPLCRAVRALVARWTGTAVPAGYREPGPVTRMATGYWWNGDRYERTRRDALMDQRMRTYWRDPATWRDLRFTALAPLTAGLPACLPPAGAAAAVLALTGAAPLLVGPIGAAVAIGTAPYAWRALEPAAVRFLRPSTAMLLADRVDQLTAQRADMTVTQAAEIRRIERDLHDGAQAGLVAIGISLATAERLMATDPERARALLRSARAGAAGSLAELRDLVRGINPPVLSERGLVDAVRALALTTPIAVTVTAPADRPRLRLDPPIESALYFGTAELLTNAVKHARATAARITLAHDGTGIVVEIEDDGRGGATVRPDGGLAGLRRRLAVFDGTFELDSPEGGPTRAIMVVPCESL